MRAPFDDLLFVSQAPFRSNEHSIRLIQVGTTHIASLNSLEVIPDALVQIEVGRIARQLPQMQALSCSLFEKLLDFVFCWIGVPSRKSRLSCQISGIRGHAEIPPSQPRHRKLSAFV